MTDQTAPAARTVTRPDGASIAYRMSPGESPTVVFLHGLRSDMTGTKAVALEAACRARGQAFLRFDCSGHGASSGRFEDGTMTEWRDDALHLLDRVTEGPLILVGSSMGGWLMLLVALERRERVAGLVGVAAAPDFTEDLMWGRMAPEQRAELERKGVIYEPSEYDEEPTAITMKLIEDGRNHLLLRDGRVPLEVPVRLLHGMRDPDVPWELSARLAEALSSEDVELTLVKAGDHRLSEPHDIARLERTVAALTDRVRS